MRRLREPSIISGRRRSRGVIESMIPICRFRVLASTAPAAAAAFACICAGSLSSSADMPPMFCNWLN